MTDTRERFTQPGTRMTARFTASSCTRCGTPIHKGNNIRREQTGWHHETCRTR